jgi:hypothetical protein
MLELTLWAQADGVFVAVLSSITPWRRKKRRMRVWALHAPDGMANGTEDSAHLAC